MEWVCQDHYFFSPPASSDPKTKENQQEEILLLHSDHVFCASPLQYLSTPICMIYRSQSLNYMVSTLLKGLSPHQKKEAFSVRNKRVERQREAGHKQPGRNGNDQDRTSRGSSRDVTDMQNCMISSELLAPFQRRQRLRAHWQLLKGCRCRSTFNGGISFRAERPLFLALPKFKASSGGTDMKKIWTPLETGGLA